MSADDLKAQQERQRDIAIKLAAHKAIAAASDTLLRMSITTTPDDMVAVIDEMKVQHEAAMKIVNKKG